jgi:O-antigen/teichoic acid export membrane protein
MLASTTLIAVRETDVIMLGVLANAADVGIYRVASQAATLVVFLSAVVNAVISPHIARLFEAKDHGNLDKLCQVSCRIATAGAAPIIILYLFFGRALLSIIFGAEYEQGSIPLLILSCGYFIYAVMAPVGPLLSMTGHAWGATAGVALAAGSNILLNLILIPAYGIAGAASASFVAILLMHVFLGYYAYRRVGVLVPNFGTVGRAHRHQ